jgi:enoyl-CoA hydratase
MNATNLVVRSRPAGGIFEARLNIPERLNAVDEDVLAQLNGALDEAESDASVRAVLIGGEGRAFCAGANYKKHVKDERTMYQKRQYVEMIFETYRRIYRFGKPVVAAVHGMAAGAGAELAVNCDFILMDDESEIWLPEIGAATFVGCGITVLLPRLVGLARAREMVMLGERVKAKDAVSMGLASRSFPVETFRASTLGFAETLAARAPIALALAKRQFNAGIARDYDTALVAEREAVLACMMTDDWSEGVRAFAERRKPVYAGR